MHAAYDFRGCNVIKQRNMTVPSKEGTIWRLLLGLSRELKDDVLPCQPAVDRREGVELVLE